MKKKGFTLIELLAVIVILGLIAIVTVPVVTNVIEKTRKEAFKDSVISAFHEVECYLAENNLPEIPEDGIEVSNLNLDQNNLDGSIIKNEKGLLEALNISNGKYCASGQIEKLEVYKGKCDEEVPNITVVVNGKEAKFTITDNKKLSGYQVTESEEVPSDWIAISGISVNETYVATKAGTYYIYAKDASQNIAHKSFVIDKSAFEETVLSNAGIDKSGTFDASKHTTAKISGNASVSYTRDCHSYTTGQASAVIDVQFACGSTVYTYNVAALTFSTQWNNVVSNKSGSFNVQLDLASHGITCSNATVKLVSSGAGVYCATGQCKSDANQWCTGNLSYSGNLTVVAN